MTYISSQLKLFHNSIQLKLETLLKDKIISDQIRELCTLLFVSKNNLIQKQNKTLLQLNSLDS